MSARDYAHTPNGFALAEFEQRDPLGERVPDWQKFLERQHFSGWLRELVDDEDMSAGEYLAELRQAVADAAERLDQAHIEALRLLDQLAARKPRDANIERALSWAAQQSYSFAGQALDSYCNARGLSWESDPMHGYITYKDTNA